jgi:CheY-like chemotaxis protein
MPKRRKLRGGLEALRQLRTDGVDVRIVLLTAHSDPQLAFNH